MGIVVVCILILYGVTVIHHARKPLPAGVDVATPWRAATDVALLLDTSYVDADGVQRNEAAIFDEVFRLIAAAERLVVLDMFLVNDFAGDTGEGHRPLSRELADVLIARKRARPDLVAVLITDPFNNLYGGIESSLFDDLEAAGVRVIETDLTRLRDPNPIWSGLWRICCQWFGNTLRNGWLPDPVGDGKVTLRTWLRLLNFKANHRKTLVVDAGDDWVGLVTSANPHDASSLHSNQAVRFHGRAALDLLATEDAVARFSGSPDAFSVPERAPVDDAHGDAALRIVTESRIREVALELIGGAEAGDQLDLAMFYLAHRDVIEAFIRAAERGVAIRVILDPNKGAFGREGSGIPNRQVAMELTRAEIDVRWCNTRGEQCHSKFLLRTGADGAVDLLAGSANLTRRNLDNYNLETNVHLRGTFDVPALDAVRIAFDERWNNEPDRVHSVDYDVYADHRRWRYLVYRFMEATGLSTF
ncbi:MAG: phospholipase [Gammaproteobacteria bacterium]|nr:MAG: phospholipase [Gammaproteobacteria bacterium]